MEDIIKMKRIKVGWMVIEGDLNWGGGHTTQSTYDAL